MSERMRMTGERLAEIEAEAKKGVVSLCLRGFEALEIVSEIRASWRDNDALRAELAEARLAAAVADGTATPEMLRDAGLLEGWELVEGRLEYRSGDVILARVFAEGNGGFVSFTSAGRGVSFPLKSEGRVPLAKEADAAVRKLLAEGEAAG